MQTTNLSNIGYIRGYQGHLDSVSSFLIQSTAASQPICDPDQQSQTYSAQYPMLTIAAGDSFVANYTENGHVTKDVLAPDNKPHPGNYTWYLAANSAASPDSMSTYGSLFSAGQVVATGNFDDGVCAEDATKGRAGPRNCQSVVTVPASLAAGSYELIWLWNFPKVAGVVEMYSSCMDIQVVTNDGTQAPVAVAAAAIQAPISAAAATSSSVPTGATLANKVKIVTQTMYVMALQPDTTTHSTGTKRTITVTNINSIFTTITPSSVPTTSSDAMIMTTIETTIGATGTQAPGIYTFAIPAIVTPQANPLVDADNAGPVKTMRKVTVTMPV